MILKKLLIENYKSFQFPTEMIFPSPDSERPILLIGGMNNSGKSSIVEAIYYCLYGAKPEKLFPDINRKELAKGNSNVKFELTFESENDEIIVSRSWSAGANESPRPKDLIEKLVVVQNGKRVSTQTKDIWQEFINSRIPLSITRFFFFDGEKIQEIAQEEHTEVRLRNSLEAVLGIEHLSQLAADIIKIKQDERRNFVDITDADIGLREKEMEVFNQKLTKLKEEKSELENEINSFTEELADTKKRFESNFGVNPLEQDVIRQKERRRNQLTSHLAKLDSDINVLIEKFLPFALSANLFSQIKNQIQLEHDAIKNATLAESADTLTKTIISSIESPPPIFENQVDEQKRKLLSDRILRVLNTQKKDTDLTTILNLSERDAGKILNKIDEIESSEIAVLEEYLNEKSDFENELKELELQLRVSTVSDTEKELFNQLQSAIESFATQIGKKKEELRVVEENIINQEEIIQQKSVELNRLYDKHISSNETRDFISECDGISNLLHNFIVRLRTSKINMLKEKTLEMFLKLASAAYQISDIRIDEKTYEISIIDREGNIIKKSGLSAGQKEIFAISLLWGLAKTSEVDLPIIIDTPLSRLDTVHRENIVQQYFTNAGHQVIILSTNTEITTEYYDMLKPYLVGSQLIKYDNITGVTSIQSGYFWS